MPRSIIVNGVEVKECSSCGEVYPITNFNRNKRNGDGYSYRCRACQGVTQTPEFYKTTSREMLEALGYNTDPECPISVHKQFLMRHNLSK